MKKNKLCFFFALFFSIVFGLERPALFAQDASGGLPGESGGQSRTGIPSQLYAAAGTGPARKLSSDEAVELAIKNNLGLESARLNADAKKRQSSLSWNQFIPTTSVQGLVNRVNEKSVTIMGPGPRWTAQGQLSFELGLNLATFERIKNLRLEYENGILSYEQARAQTEKTVRQTYYDVIYQGEQIDILEQSFANIQRQAAMAGANYRAGLIPEVDFLRAQVAVEIFKPGLDQAKNGLKTLTANFAFILGLPTNTEFELEAAPEEISYLQLDVDELNAKAFYGNWDIASLRKNILVTQSGQWAQFYSNYTPSLFFTWDLTRSMVEPWENNLFNGSNWNPGGSLTIGVRFYLDRLLPFSQGAQGVKAIDDSIAVLNNRLAQLTQQTAMGVYSTVLSLEQIRSQAEAQKLTVNLAERSYELTEQAYRGGLRQLLDVQSAEQDLREARLNMLKQNTDYLKGILDLEYAIGVPFGTLEGRN
ncbi:MAG: TolC family protein [Treponema sp.]|jgi:outer membrane protein TolC|nr:TolC family protein [Treponema sp.]